MRVEHRSILAVIMSRDSLRVGEEGAGSGEGNKLKMLPPAGYLVRPLQCEVG